MPSSRPKYLQVEYIDLCIEQTLLWMNGVSTHRNNECTVDFSCCYPDLRSDKSVRLVQGQTKLAELFERRRSVL